MKTSLEDKIRQNRDAFNDQLPPAGHLERFEQRLYESEQRTWQRSTFRAALVAVAAVVAVALIFRFALPSSPQTEPMSDVQQVARYYDGQLNEQANQIEHQLVRLDPQSREAIVSEIRSLVASSRITDPEYALMTQQEQINYTVRRYHSYQQSLQTIENMLNDMLNNAAAVPPNGKPGS